MKDKSTLMKLERFVYKYRFVIGPAFAALLVAVPLLGLSSTMMRLFLLILIYCSLGMGLNILLGYTGLMSLGQAGFYAIGAYAAALLMTRLNFNFWTAAISAASITALIGLGLGIPTLRLSGTYMAITTMGFFEVVIMILKQWSSLTNGNYGIRSIPLPRIFGFECTLNNGGLYWVILGFTFLIAGACHFITKSKTGRALFAIRDDEMAAAMMGIKTSRYKILAFTLSSFTTGLVGAFYCTINNGFIEPKNFTFNTSVLILSVVVVGGMGTIRGMLFGAALLQLFPQFTRFLDDWRYIIYGLLLVLMMRFRPQGVLGWESTLPYHIPKRAKEVLKNSADDPGPETEWSTG